MSASAARDVDDRQSASEGQSVTGSASGGNYTTATPRGFLGGTAETTAAIHAVLRQQLREGSAGEAINPEAVPVVAGSSLSPAPPQPQSDRRSARLLRSGQGKRSVGGESPSTLPGDYRLRAFVSPYEQLPAPRPSIQQPAAHSSFSVMLGPYQDTKFGSHVKLDVVEVGSLAKVVKGQKTGAREHEKAAGVELATVFGFHPVATRINMSRGAPPDTRLAVQAVLLAEHDVMNAVVEIIDVENRVALNLALEVRLNEAHHREERIKSSKYLDERNAMERRLSETASELEAAKKLISTLESRAAQLQSDLQSAIQEKRILRDKDALRERELERYKDFEKRRVEERRAEIARETEMERARQREREAIRQREAERDAERALEKQRQIDREAERKSFGAELELAERERRVLLDRETQLTARVASLEDEVDKLKGRERQWRAELRRVLAENMICQFCNLRKQTEAALHTAEAELQRLCRQSVTLQSELARRRVQVFPLQLNPPGVTDPADALEQAALAVTRCRDLDGLMLNATVDRTVNVLASAEPGFLHAHNLDRSESDDDCDGAAAAPERRESGRRVPARVAFSIDKLELAVEPKSLCHADDATALFDDGDVAAEDECDPSVAVLSLRSKATRHALREALNAQLHKPTATPALIVPHLLSVLGTGNSVGGASPLLMQTPTISNTNTPKWPRDTSTISLEVSLPTRGEVGATVTAEHTAINCAIIEARSSAEDAASHPAARVLSQLDAAENTTAHGDDLQCEHLVFIEVANERVKGRKQVIAYGVASVLPLLPQALPKPGAHAAVGNATIHLAVWCGPNTRDTSLTMPTRADDAVRPPQLRDATASITTRIEAPPPFVQPISVPVRGSAHPFDHVRTIKLLKNALSGSITLQLVADGIDGSAASTKTQGSSSASPLRWRARLPSLRELWRGIERVADGQAQPSTTATDPVGTVPDPWQALQLALGNSIAPNDSDECASPAASSGGSSPASRPLIRNGSALSASSDGCRDDGPPLTSPMRIATRKRVSNPYPLPVAPTPSAARPCRGALLHGFSDDGTLEMVAEEPSDASGRLCVHFRATSALFGASGEHLRQLLHSVVVDADGETFVAPSGYTQLPQLPAGRATIAAWVIVNFATHCVAAVSNDEAPFIYGAGLQTPSSTWATIVVDLDGRSQVGKRK